MSGFLTMRKISIVRTMFTRSARYGTPQRVGGRVAATNNKSAARPSVGSVISLNAEQTANPGDDRLRGEHEADANDHPDRPTPGDTARGGGDTERHHQEHGDRCGDRRDRGDEICGP